MDSHASKEDWTGSKDLQDSAFAGWLRDLRQSCKSCLKKIKSNPFL